VHFKNILIGTERAMKKTFGSTCHGAGRIMSRYQARQAKDRSIKREMEDRGVIVRRNLCRGDVRGV
jgi:tRNA-splicing ligase RtcB